MNGKINQKVKENDNMENLMEKRDLYDENKELTGETIYKGQIVPKGKYYITVIIFIQNENNKFFIPKKGTALWRKDVNGET